MSVREGKNGWPYDLLPGTLGLVSRTCKTAPRAAVFSRWLTESSICQVLNVTCVFMYVRVHICTPVYMYKYVKEARPGLTVGN